MYYLSCHKLDRHPCRHVIHLYTLSFLHEMHRVTVISLCLHKHGNKHKHPAAWAACWGTDNLLALIWKCSPLSHHTKPKCYFGFFLEILTSRDKHPLFVTEKFLASGGSLASHRGCDKLFKKPFIFHFNQSKSTLIKKIHCRLLNLYGRLPIPNNQVKSLMSDR